jgi:hypothetical protein
VLHRAALAAEIARNQYQQEQECRFFDHSVM